MNLKEFWNFCSLSLALSEIFIFSILVYCKAQQQVHSLNNKRSDMNGKYVSFIGILEIKGTYAFSSKSLSKMKYSSASYKSKFYYFYPFQVYHIFPRYKNKLCTSFCNCNSWDCVHWNHLYIIKIIDIHVLK